MRKVAAAPLRRFCRLALRDARAGPSLWCGRVLSKLAREVVALWQSAKGREKRWGDAVTATAPVAERPSYFFFAFLAFLAAFFAFLAIVPPEGVRLCLMATPVVVQRVSVVHKPLSEPSALIPDVDYG